MERVPDFLEQYFVIQEQVYKRKEHIGKLQKNIISKGTSSKQSLTNKEA